MKKGIFALGLSLILGMILIGCDTEIKSPDNEPRPPDAPTEITLTAFSSRGIYISWKPVTGATSYQIHYKKYSTEKYSWLAGETSDTSFYHTELEPNTYYTYYITAHNNIGSSENSLPKGISTLGSSGGPDVPSGVTATALSPNSVRISWDPVEGATSYVVHDSGRYEFIALVDVNSYTHTDLEPSTYYGYCITANNSIGSSAYSSTASALTLSATGLPNVPTGVTATARSSGSIYVTWEPVEGATSYGVYYQIGSSSTKNFAANVSDTSYTHTGLQPNTRYYYYIRAHNDLGSSRDSLFISGVQTIWPPEFIEAFTGVNQFFDDSLTGISDEKWYKISFSTPARAAISGLDRESEGDYTADIVGSLYSSTGNLVNTGVSRVDFGTDEGRYIGGSISATYYLRIEVNPANPYPGTYLVGIIPEP